MAKALRILVDASLSDSPWVAALQQQGHEVLSMGMAEIDLVLGPTCCRFLPGMEFALDSIIKGARLVKYGKTTKAQGKRSALPGRIV